MSNFGLFFIFAQICLIIGMRATNLIGKHFSVFLFHWFSLRFREITFLVTFFAVLLLREKQKNPFVSITFFAYVISQKRKENQQKKKKYREMFCYQFVAYMPKIRQI